MNPYIGLVLGIVIGAVAAWLIAVAFTKSRVAETFGKLAAREDEKKMFEERIALMNARIDELTNERRVESEKRAAAEARAEQAARIETEVASLREQSSNLKENLATVSETLNKEREATESRKGINEKLEVELSTLRKQNTDQKESLAKISETLNKEREAWKEKLLIIEEAKTNLADAFKALSSEALKSNNQAFIDLARQTLEVFHNKAKGELGEKEKAIETLVKPLREALEGYDKQLRNLETNREGAYKSLETQVKSLLETEQSLKKETGKLVSALSSPQVRGHWGEITLRRVAELAGMNEWCDFDEQESVDTEGGKLRPDMIVNLPNNRKIVIDAKAPLKAYMEAVEATSDEGRQAKYIEHARQVKTRAQELCKKEYWDQFKEAPEFVVLFLPGEQFLGAALQQEPGLLEDAFTRKVIIATPTTLIALLKAIAYGWRQEALAENAQKISELGKMLYERLATLASHFEDLGKSLDKSVQAYNNAVGSMERRVLVAARKFKELGTTDKEDIPELPPIDHATRQMLPIGFETETLNQPPEAQA